MKKIIYSLLLCCLFTGNKINAQDNQQIIQSVLATISTDSLHSYIQRLQNFGTRFMLAPNRREVAEWIRLKFASFGYENAHLDSFQCEEEWPWYSGNYVTTWQYNVIATLEGTQTPDEIYVMGAHHDAILNQGNPILAAPGADDNASGVAAALEMARVLKNYKYQPLSSIMFATFAAEELGLIGSFDLAERLANQNADIKLMLNNDMISTIQSGNDWLFNFSDYGVNWIEPLVEEIAENYSTLTPYRDNSMQNYSDSYSFDYYGYPAIFFAEYEFSPFYHTTNDLIGNCDMDYCAEITKLSGAILMEKNGVNSSVGFNELATANAELLSNYPNPFSHYTKLRYRLDKAQNIELSVYDATGKLMSVVENEFKQKGNYKVDFAAENLKSGIYFCRLKTENSIKTIKLNVVK